MYFGYITDVKKKLLQLAKWEESNSLNTVMCA